MLKCQDSLKLLQEIKYTTTKARTKRDRGVEYINLACGFDTETTSIEVNERKGAFVYIWMCGIGHGQPIYYGRTLAEFQEFCENLVTVFDLGPKRRLPIYVHNLGYDFEFIRKDFEWDFENSFFMDKNEPARALTTSGIEFRDSLKLSGLNLELTGKNLLTYKVSKKVGDLDYTLPRTPKTELTEEELGYCESDIEVVTAYIQEQIDYYGDVIRIPMTNTGRVRDLLRYNCFCQGKVDPKTGTRKKGGGGAQHFKSLMKSLTMDVESYQFARLAFAGGFTHANKHKAGQIHHNVHSIDFTSSYPAVMVSEKFPMSAFKDYEFTSEEDFKRKMKTHALLMRVTFSNIRAVTKQDSYISASKCRGYVYEAAGCKLINPVINNGRVDSASELTMYLTEVDLKILMEVYDYEDMIIEACKIAIKGYLPKPILKTIFELYQGKTELKGVEGKEREYQLSKGMLNSVYGASVMDFIKDSHGYDSESDSWVVAPADKEEAIEQYNSSEGRFLYYPWGVWITAYSRYNLWTGILELGDDYIYSDTDSLKFTNLEDHQDYIDVYNETVTAKIARCAKEMHLDLTDDELVPKTIKGVAKPLGVWDYEGCYSRFKTMGAKKYLVEEDGILHLTVAGLSPKRGVKYIQETCQNNNDAAFEMFSNGMHVPAVKTGKMTHTFLNNEEWEADVTDYCGGQDVVRISTGVHLENTSFTVNLSQEYMDLVDSCMKAQLMGEKRT